MHPDSLTPRIQKYERAESRCLSLLAAAKAAGVEEANRCEVEAAEIVATVLGACEFARSGASREEVLAWNRTNLPPYHLIDDDAWERYVEFIEKGSDGPIDAVSTVVGALERATDELGWVIGHLEDLLGVEPEDEEGRWWAEFKRRQALERPIRERADRLVRRWERRNPEPQAPDPWDRSLPGYREKLDRWRDWTTRSGRVWLRARARVIAEMKSGGEVRRPVRSDRSRCRSRRHSPRRARAPARPSDDEPPSDLDGSAA